MIMKNHWVTMKSVLPNVEDRNKDAIPCTDVIVTGQMLLHVSDCQGSPSLRRHPSVPKVAYSHVGRRAGNPS